MYKIIKGMVIGTMLGVALGSMMNMDDMTCTAKKYIRKGKRMLNNMM